MMIRLFVILIALFFLYPSYGAEPRRIAFERGRDIWVANQDGSGAKKITRGIEPNISPDGTKVAFHIEVFGGLPDRHIAVADVASKAVTVLKKEIPSSNCKRAVWSPDGTRILFDLTEGTGEWFVGLLSVDESGFRYLKRVRSVSPLDLWSSCWAPDGKSIYSQNLDAITQRSLEGGVLKSWEVQNVFPKSSMTSSTHMAVSPDGNTLLLEMEVTDEEVNRKDWDGPPPSIWTLDLTTEKATRLTPKGFFAWHGVWLSNDEILFVSQAENEKQPSLWRMNSKGENRKLLMKNADRPSVSR